MRTLAVVAFAASGWTIAIVNAYRELPPPQATPFTQTAPALPPPSLPPLGLSPYPLGMVDRGPDRDEYPFVGFIDQAPCFYARRYRVWASADVIDETGKPPNYGSEIMCGGRPVDDKDRIQWAIRPDPAHRPLSYPTS
jgi:hypothetical protein